MYDPLFAMSHETVNTWVNYLVLYKKFSIAIFIYIWFNISSNTILHPIICLLFIIVPFISLQYQIVTPDSPISKWRSAPPPMMDLRSNGDDLDSVGSYESSRSSGSLLMSQSVQKPMQNLNAFERIAIE